MKTKARGPKMRSHALKELINCNFVCPVSHSVTIPIAEARWTARCWLFISFLKNTGRGLLMWDVRPTS